MSLTMKASVWFVICGVMKDAVDILVTPIFTRILTKDQYGIFNVYNSWFQIVKILFTLYLFSEVFNVGLVRFEKDRDRFVSSTLGFITASVGVFFLLYVVLYKWIDGIIGLPVYLVLLMFAHILVYVPYYCWIRRERYDYHYKNVVIVSLLYVILQPLLGILGILFLNIPLDPGHIRVIAAVGVQIVIGAVLYFGMMFRGRTFYSAEYWKYSIKTGVELVPYNLSKVVLNQSDRIMINYYTGSGDTAVYSVAHSAAFVLQAVTEALDGAFVPWLYRKLKGKDYEGIHKVTTGLVVIVAVCVVGIDIIAPEIMKILGSGEYYQGVYCIPPLVLSVFLIFVYMLFANIELFFGKNAYVTIVSSIGMAVNILLNAIFIPRYGFVAAGFTTLAGYSVICLGHMLLLRICLDDEQIQFAKLFDLRTVFLISFTLFGFTLACGPLYQMTVLRWIVTLLLLGAVILTRKRWFELLNSLKGDM